MLNARDITSQDRDRLRHLIEAETAFATAVEKHGENSNAALEARERLRFATLRSGDCVDPS